MFLPERAIILSKMGQYKAALEIYVFKLKDYAKAEKYEYVDEINCRYCIQIYSQAGSSSSQHQESARNVFHTLLNLYLTAKPTLLVPALDILAKHSPRLDASKALSLIPSEIRMDNLESFFTKHIRKQTSALNEGRIVSELRKVELLRMESNAMRLRGIKAVVREESACPYCHKRLGQSVVAVIPE
jgi:Vam6/Vps39-like protein vacuolar protein sorting-associated protein 39